MASCTNAHDDPKLAENCYPSGSKNTALSMCLCGAVEIVVRTDSPVLSAFCHCQDCRRGHAAPMYQVLYCATSNIDCRTGDKKSGEFEVQVVKGFEQLKGHPGGMSNVFHKNANESTTSGGIGRLHCQVCGTRMLIAWYRKPENVEEYYGVFPATFTEKMSAFDRRWQPKMHLHCESAIVPVASICDGLPKYLSSSDSEKLFQ